MLTLYIGLSLTKRKKSIGPLLMYKLQYHLPDYELHSFELQADTHTHCEDFLSLKFGSRANILLNRVVFFTFSSINCVVST